MIVTIDLNSITRPELTRRLNLVYARLEAKWEQEEVREQAAEPVKQPAASDRQNKKPAA